VWREHTLGFHHAPFDVAVAHERLGLPIPPWDRVHDTLPLLFLDDPHAPDLTLKGSAERLLGMKPAERDAVHDWLLENQPVPGVRVTRSTPAAKYVAYVPGTVAAAYARGDVVRTRRLYELLLKRIAAADMSDAYDRERQLLPILYRTEREGIAVDADRLDADIGRYTRWFERVDDWLARELKTPGLNVSSGRELAEALIRSGYATEERLGVTKTGKLRTSRDALSDAVDDQRLLMTLRYRAQLKTFLGTFMRPWAAMASASGGRMYTSWSSTRSTEEGRKRGRYPASGRTSYRPAVACC
jgi:DNA polymerase I-like protein with 3'-5' exonuclease and polymerase domains